MKQFSIKLHSQAETEALAEKIAALTDADDVITLTGELGAGKTTLVRALIRKLCKNKDLEVVSPTFNLLQIYDSKNFPIWHFDLYRIVKENDVEQLGLYDAIGDALVIVEWPEKIKNSLPDNTLDLNLKYSNNKGERILTVSSSQSKWKKLDDR